MAIQPIGYYFQNAFNDRLCILSQMDYGDLAELQMFILQAIVQAKILGTAKLDMVEAVDELESDSLPVHSGIAEAIEVLDGFPSVDSLNLIRAIVDIMETAKVD